MDILFKLSYKIATIITVTMFKIHYGNSLIIGKNFSTRKRLNIRIKKNACLRIGDNVFFNNDCSLNCMAIIKIGDNCIFGENVKLYDHNHVFQDRTCLIRQQGYRTEPIEIGDNCWLGSNVIILPGVKIGNNCVIGAGCIIYKEIPDGAIVKNKQVLNISVS